jgi:hypothetical protein
MRSVALAILLGGASAAALELSTDGSGGRDFLYVASDGSVAVGSRLDLGAGYVLLTDRRGARHAGAIAAELDLEPIQIGARFEWAPLQSLGWIAGTLRLEHSIERGRVTLTSAVEASGRRIEAGTFRGPAPVNQLELVLEEHLAVGARVELAAQGMVSFYDPDPSARWLRGADLGPAITVGGRAAHWAAGTELAGRAIRRLRLAVMFAGAAYADGRGGALLPRVAVRAGPFAGLSVGAGLELVIGVGAAAREAPRPIGLFEASYSR